MIVIFILATACSLLIRLLGIGNESIIMVYLLGVLFTTVLTSSYVYGIIASVTSLMLFNFLFTEPRFTFIIYRSSDVILLLFFLVTAVVSGVVTSRLRQQMALAAKNERTAQILYRIASGFLSVSGKRNIIQQGIAYIREYVKSDCLVRLHEDETAYKSSDDVQGEPHHDFVIRSSSGELGVLRVYSKQQVIDAQTELIIQAVVTQLGIALDREQLYVEQGNIRLAMEHERLRATLLRSIAHDLRSPLTALSGAGNLLADDYENLSEEKRRKLVSDISEEITWLISLVENILHMTRINESRLVIQKQEEVVDDVVSEAISHVDRFLKGREFSVTLPDDVVMIKMDGQLIVKVLINLLENAIRHTPPDSKIALTVKKKNDGVEMVVSDTGEGIAEQIRDQLFDRFVTMEKEITDGKKGMGLGLAICKAIIEAHGGRIHVEPNQPQGAKFVFTLPAEVKDE